MKEKIEAAARAIADAVADLERPDDDRDDALCGLWYAVGRALIDAMDPNGDAFIGAATAITFLGLGVRDRLANIRETHAALDTAHDTVCAERVRALLRLVTIDGKPVDE